MRLPRVYFYFFCQVPPGTPRSTAELCTPTVRAIEDQRGISAGKKT